MKQSPMRQAGLNSSTIFPQRDTLRTYSLRRANGILQRRPVMDEHGRLQRNGAFAAAAADFRGLMDGLCEVQSHLHSLPAAGQPAGRSQSGPRPPFCC